MDSLRNILETGHVGLLFLIPGMGETLRVNGRWPPVNWRQLPEAHRGQIKHQRVQECPSGGTAARQDFEEILLVGLPKCQAIDHALLPELRETRDVAPKGPFEYVAGDFRPLQHPPRLHSADIAMAVCELGEPFPRRPIRFVGIAPDIAH